MSEFAPQGPNGVTLAERTVRHLGVEVANVQITLATQNARIEEIAEVASQVNFDVWESLPPTPQPDTAHEGGPIPMPPAEERYLIPAYQVDAVARLVSMLLRQ